jgi:hypothetical protein
MHKTYFFKRLKYHILRNTQSKVQFEDLGYITVLNILVKKVTGKGIPLALK